MLDTIVMVSIIASTAAFHTLGLVALCMPNITERQHKILEEALWCTFGATVLSLIAGAVFAQLGWM